MSITITSPANLVSVSPMGFLKKPLTIKIIPDKSSLNATNVASAGGIQNIQLDLLVAKEI